MGWLEGVEEVGEADRLDEKRGRAQGPDFLETAGITGGGRDDDAGASATIADGAEQFGAVAVGEHQVENDRVRPVLVEQVEALGEGRGDEDVPAALAEQHKERALDQAVVLHEQEAGAELGLSRLR